MSHLTEKQINLYLDGELGAAECAVVEAHLADCDACRAELASLRELFVALDALQPELLTADLAPLVLRRAVEPASRVPARRRIGWLVPVLQGAAVVVLCVLGWSALSALWNDATQRFPAEPLRTAWTAALVQGNVLWTAFFAPLQTWWTETMVGVSDLPAVLAQVAERWPHLPGLEFTALQVLAIGLAATLVWLAGNSILLWTTAVRSGFVRQLKNRWRRFVS